MNPKWRRLERDENGICIVCESRQAVWQDEKNHAEPRLCDGCAPARVVIGDAVGYMPAWELASIVASARQQKEGTLFRIAHECMTIRSDFNLVNEALTRVQERDSELITENRRLRGVFDFRADRVYRGEFPGAEGVRLAEELLRRNTDFNMLVIDVSHMRPEALISSYYMTFYRTIVEKRPELRDKLRQLIWRTAHDFQRESINMWMRDFEEYSAQFAARNASTA